MALLSGAMPGWPFEGLLDNATMIATRPTSLTLDPDNGQEIGDNPQSLTFRCYLKRNDGAIAGYGGDGFETYEGGGGIDPEQVEKINGFADRILPSWVLKQAEIICNSDDLGEGIFYPMPNIRPARGLVEAETGSYLYGKFLTNR
jgi:hypothetical protein